MRTLRPWTVTIAILWAAVAAAAQSTAPPAAPPAPAAPPPAPCSAPEHRQFDFWIGEWEVRDPKGELAGTNRIEKILNGCALQENWTGARGDKGTSFNIYDAPAKRWHQTWVSDNGLLLVLDGAFQDGKMVLSGERVPRQGGGLAKHRITWTPVDADHVRQHWEMSRDGGKTWGTVFDGTYTRKKPAA
ncbi:MAG TPA: DUF1579 family protein [Thermoanaerobaculia bacterium]